MQKEVTAEILKEQQSKKRCKRNFYKIPDDAEIIDISKACKRAKKSINQKASELINI